LGEDRAVAAYGPFLTVHTAVVLVAAFLIGSSVGGLTYLTGTPAHRRPGRFSRVCSAQKRASPHYVTSSGDNKRALALEGNEPSRGTS